MNGSVRFVAITLLAAGSAAACGSSPAGVQVTAQEYGAEWPFTVSEGRLECRQPGSSVVFTVGDVTYAVNGTARGQKRWPEVDPIVKKRSLEGAGTPVVINYDVSPLIDRGLKLCRS